MLGLKTSLVLVRVADAAGGSRHAEEPEEEAVVLHRTAYTVRGRGSSDQSGAGVPALDCAGVSNKAHMEINAKRCPLTHQPTHPTASGRPTCRAIRSSSAW
jgi:hypothetical protein